ncbi:carboxypeptidase-like regulatory domain-containing protein [Winogradskyella immobilis]|uniref:Carboxypeptidase-like regulatory domain-containing protein n=1 Tax=Winogradskyella immobilis TaxID=2816852 RepID=A0ABS8EQG4_9FLAO|nr:carboxypeptidase-like regulatory domain-containing protein [Winogradskyella immobilis]MCC1484542.1 carboxypeptidase-like regulatory domain-containing protein [Winogradskyella immobilis]MCG0016634.1 carboxypeptidase-like regulatory domain-containing protein [Winogradskyella immobilis]
MIINIRKQYFYFFFLCFSVFSFSQDAKELLCKVIDSGDKLPIAYATIQFQKSSSGVISNVDGDFRIPYSYKTNKDSIIISCIGYQTKTIPLITLEDQTINIIALNQKVELLEQITIKGKKKEALGNLNPYSIVKTAIEKIPENYPNNPFSTISYYRDYQIVKNRYYNVNEAIIESFDKGFSTDVIMDSYNQAAIFKYRENEEFLRDSSLVRAYDGNLKYIENTELSGQGGNELGILNIHDPIRNYEQLSFSFVYVFKKVFIENHEFTNIKKVFLDDKVLYEIPFKAKDQFTGIAHKAIGKIYIAKDNYAIHKLEYKVLDVANKEFLNDEELLFEVTLEYKPKGDKMFLNYITFNNRFVVSDNFFFDVVKTEYQAEEKAFYVSFNSPVLESSVSKKDFRFKYSKKKMVIKNFELVDAKTIKVNIADWSIPKELLVDEPNMNNIETQIKNIYDISNRKIFKSPKIAGYQFRELFVQEVINPKIKPTDIEFTSKAKPLSKAKINKSNDKEDYWLNSPLKTVNN